MGVGLVALAVALPLAACGSAGERPVGAAAARTAPAPAPATGDTARAKRALIRLSDLGRGWHAQAGKVRRLHCTDVEPFAGATALVRSPRLIRGRLGTQERIAIFRSTGAARHALRRLDTPAASRCLRREVRRHASEEAGGPAGPARLVRSDRLGPASQAARYVSTTVGVYGRVATVIDAVHVRVGRAIAAILVVSGGPAPLEASGYEQLRALATRRLQVALG